MNTNTVKLREIRKGDDPMMAEIIRRVLEEFGITREGSTYADRELDHLFETFSIPRAAYFIAEGPSGILGGAGIIQLKAFAGNTCELQKMYLLKEARGIGLGSKMLGMCLEKAREFGYGSCYLESMPSMETAQRLYQNAGFRYLNEAMGDTGHYSCKVWMTLEL